jgi:broad specificity phosphatase PhoE
VPLTDRGRKEARRVGEKLAGRRFALVLTSPLSRALETCRLAGLGAQAETREELREWDYGAYEGLTTAEVQVEHPAWTIWTGEVPGGETIAEVAARADRVLEEVRAAEGHSSRTGISSRSCRPVDRTRRPRRPARPRPRHDQRPRTRARARSSEWNAVLI